MFDSLRLPLRGCARRRVSECNRRRRHLARRLKLSAKRTDEGQAYLYNPFTGNCENPPLIRLCGATFPLRGKANITFHSPTVPPAAQPRRRVPRAHW